MKLWTNNFQWICESNFWLYNSIYALLAGIPLMLTGLPLNNLAVSILFFAAGIWIPGAFTAHLIDRFKRKNVYLFALLGCVLTTVPIPHTMGHPEWLYVLRLIQGLCYGYAINLGSILTTDTTSSPQRSKANSILARFGRNGIWTGVAGVGVTHSLMGPEGIYFFALGCGLLALVCAFMLSITFRAPLELSVVSLDRFFLPRTWPEALNVFFLAILPGILVSSSLGIVTRLYPDPVFQWIPWAAFLVGTLLSFVIRHSILKSQGYRMQIGVGFLLLITGCIVFSDFVNFRTLPLALLLIGMGTETVASLFLYSFIRMSRHCERSTANSSFLFSWETGCALGACIGLYNYPHMGNITLFSILIAFILYFAFTSKHYKRHRKR